MQIAPPSMEKKIGSKILKPPPRMKFHYGNHFERLTTLCSEKFEGYAPSKLSKYKSSILFENKYERPS